MDQPRRKKTFGIIGGLGALAGADVFFKLVKSTPPQRRRSEFDFVFEQRAFDAGEAAGDVRASQVARKLYIYDRIKDFEQRKVDTVILPCFISHTFIGELRNEVKLPIVDMMEALRTYVKRQHPSARRIGVLTSDYVKSKELFKTYFGTPDYQVIYPRLDAQAQLMAAIYGTNGLQAGQLQGESVAGLQAACRDVAEQGAELIVPGFTEIAMVADRLQECGFPVLDSNQIYAQYAFSHDSGMQARTYKVGIVGGVGPAATVDFMDKIIRNTDARRDQEHIKLVVEHNPQIPDRTENLVSDGADPTVALYATCKKLEADDANMIAIPCNTAHAFVERIQPYLSIPIVNMLFETVQYIKSTYPSRGPIGLLATSGTIKSRVYHDVAEKAGLTLIVPDDANQKLVMDSIYGKQGVKAGFTDGQCRTELMRALGHLVENGAGIIVLGCTELPLLLAQSENLRVGNRSVVVLDPTEILARKCVQLSLSIPHAP